MDANGEKVKMKKKNKTKDDCQHQSCRCMAKVCRNLLLGPVVALERFKDGGCSFMGDIYPIWGVEGVA